MPALRLQWIDGLTVITSVAALILSGFAVAEHFNQDELTSARSDRDVEQWDNLLANGFKTGPQDAALKIVVFEDYECPACRSFYRALKSVMPQYGSDIQVIHRHLPLTYHPYAYNAARAVECAGMQDKRIEYHGFLYEHPESLGKWKEVAEAVRITDLAAFNGCAQDTTRLSVIERDIATANAIKAFGTPTVIANGIIQGQRPDSAKLVALVEAARRSETKPVEKQ